MRNRNRLPLLLTALALLCGGCSSTFQKDWKRGESAALAGGEPRPDDHLSGRWKGSWKSDSSGHAGGLRCIAERSGEGEYTCRFEATYAAIFHFGYTMRMTADVREDITYVAGEQDLGKSYGGVYEYEGTSDGGAFRLNYKTKNDYGHFTLQRPG